MAETIQDKELTYEEKERQREEEYVKYVEDFADKLEQTLTKELCEIYEDRYFYGAKDKISVSATISALRIHYYIVPPKSEDDRYNDHTLFKKLHFLLFNERSNWDILTLEEKAALLSHERMSYIIVSTKDRNLENEE